MTTANNEKKAVPKSRARKKPPKAKPRFKLADAWRVVGLDELRVARTMKVLIVGLSKKPSSEKVLLDAVKESIRVLEPARAAAKTGPSEGPVAVILEHHVPRPDRPAA